MLTEVAVSVVFTHQSLALHAGVGGWEAGMQLAVVYNTQATQFKINRPVLVCLLYTSPSPRDS